MSYIKIRKVSKLYSPNVGVNDINLEVKKGNFISIVGPFGSGKTTLLRILAGLESEFEGHVDIDGLTPAEARKKRRIGVGFQQPTLLPWRNVFENITLPLDITNNHDYGRAEELLALTGLSSIKNKKVDELSGGMRQLVSIVRSLVLDPDILLLDEPFSSIDEMSKDIMHKKLRALHKSRGSTTILVTHSLQEAVFLSDEVIIFSESPATVKRVIKIDYKRSNINDKYSEEAYKYVRELRKELGA